MIRRFLRSIALPIAAFTAVSGVAGAASGGEELALRRVMLSAGGVGYFEYEAKVTDAAELSLDVRLDQIDDILKSIVIFDDQGNTGAVSLPVKQPLRETFRELPFPQGALDSPVKLLNALRGAEVRITTASANEAVPSAVQVVEGRIVSVTREQVEMPHGHGKITQHRITIASAEGLRSAILERMGTLRFLDDKLAQQIEQALVALLKHKSSERRELTIHLPESRENAARMVHVGYVVEAPLWKTTYRLAVSGDADVATGRLQGFATLENLSGEDWQNVDLTLVSGNPVTFHQALYDAYYVDRPEVPVEVLGRVLPMPDTGAMAAAAPRPFARPKRARHVLAAMRAPEPTALLEAADAGGAVELPISLPEPAEAETLVVFHFPDPVTAANGQTLHLPIVNDDIPVRRMALYQPQVHAHNPLASLELLNTTKTGLPPGALTLYEHAQGDGEANGMTYLGDARLGWFPADERRIVSFAVDQAVRIDRETERAQRIQTGRIVRGVLEMTEIASQTTTYTIAGAPEGRLIVIEHPRMAGWDLAEPTGEQIERTPDNYRIPVKATGDESFSLKVVLTKPISRTLKILDLSSTQIAAYAAAADLPEKIRQAFEQIATMQATVANLKAAVDNIDAELKEIAKDQARIRSNLRTVPAGSDLQARYIALLAQQEDQIENLRAKKEEAQKALDEARQNLADYVAKLNLL